MSDVLTQIEGGVARLTVNRPRSRNAMTPEVMDEMLAFARSLLVRDDVGVLVLDAAGEHFVSGGDVKGFAEVATRPPEERGPAFEALVHRMIPLYLTLEQLPQVVIASARGWIGGSGMCLVAAADLALVSDTARFALSHVNIGAVPDAGATYYLPRQLGAKRAKELIYLGDPLGADEALRLGLVNRVVPDALLNAETNKLAQRLAQGPWRAYAESKTLVNESAERSLAAQMWAEARAVGRIAQTEDLVEGVRAFAEKRAPRFAGHLRNADEHPGEKT